jgi:hypothetical protein
MYTGVIIESRRLDMTTESWYLSDCLTAWSLIVTCTMMPLLSYTVCSESRHLPDCLIV